jgi:hypothetical protein
MLRARTAMLVVAVVMAVGCKKRPSAGEQKVRDTAEREKLGQSYERLKTILQAWPSWTSKQKCDDEGLRSSLGENAASPSDDVSPRTVVLLGWDEAQIKLEPAGREPSALEKAFR